MNDPFAAILSRVRETTGLAFSGDRLRDAQGAVDRTIQRSNFRDAAALLAVIETNRNAFDALVAELTVGETYFFRDPHHFELIARIARERSELSIFSAGCASGEEAYSVAIALDEAGLASRATITGGDLSVRALEHARVASYRPWSMRGLRSQRIARYFKARDGRFELNADIKHRVELKRFNVVRDALLPLAFDIVLCRNVLLYLDGENVARAVERLVNSLRPNGVLITGPSDPPLFEHPSLQPTFDELGLHYRRRVIAEACVPVTPSLGIQANAAGADPSPKLYLDRAIALLDAGLAEESIVELRRALYLDRHGASAHFLLGRALSLLGDLRGADRAFENARRLLKVTRSSRLVSVR